MSEKTSNYREDFPGYQGHIPYKFGIIGKTVGATNETIKQLLTTEPPKTTLLKPADCTDFSQYDRDYYCDTFYRGYPLEEDKIYSNSFYEASIIPIPKTDKDITKKIKKTKLKISSL